VYLFRHREKKEEGKKRNRRRRRRRKRIKLRKEKVKNIYSFFSQMDDESANDQVHTNKV